MATTRMAFDTQSYDRDATSLPMSRPTTTDSLMSTTDAPMNTYGLSERSCDSLTIRYITATEENS